MSKKNTLIIVLITLYLTGCATTRQNMQKATGFEQQSHLGSMLSGLENRNGNTHFKVELLPKYGGEYLHIGDVFDIDLRSSRKSFLHLYLFQTSGKVTALTENMPVIAGVKQSFPPNNATYQLTARLPAGNNTLLLLATTTPIAGTIKHDYLYLRQPENIISTQLGAVAAIKNQLRGIPTRDWQSTIRDIMVYH